MNCGSQEDSPPYITNYGNGPYSSSIASSASSSSASVWSDAASQSSDDSSVTGSDHGSQSSCTSRSSLITSHITTQWPKVIPASLVPEQRQNPRRTNVGAIASGGCPPALIRQSDRKVNFVDSLVDSSTQIVEAIWPLSSGSCRAELGSKGVLPLRTFIQETLRRSRTSYSTLQVALYYLLLIKPHVPKRDFTMEQLEDIHSARALQCGRRMFLSALILASKYLQDRNYSARAWSKISGLNTLEINQNEMAFLLAVNWNLHITEAVYQKWNDIVLKYTPTQPPSPGTGSLRHSTEKATWKAIILKLEPELNNLDDIMASAQPKTTTTTTTTPLQSIPMPSSLSYVESSYNFGGSSSGECTPTPNHSTPHIMEPAPTSTHVQNKFAPALGLLPTPRLTPQSTGFSTPAVSAAPYCLNKSSAMGYAMAQASGVCSLSALEKWHQPTSSPSNFNIPRRSSLATSVSSASSPDSMVSDHSSRSSRSSSISSASSLVSAPFSSKLDVQARCRYAKLWSEKSVKPTIASVCEGEEITPTSSPESYTGPVGKDMLELTLETPVTVQPYSNNYFNSGDSINDAARALQELHNCPRSEQQQQYYQPTTAHRTGSKRTRPRSIDIDQSLQGNVRHMLMDPYGSSSSQIGWNKAIFTDRSASQTMSSPFGREHHHRSTPDRKRVCCSTEELRHCSASDSNSHLNAFVRFGRPGMWEGILN